jgi:hypothetical protein
MSFEEDMAKPQLLALVKENLPQQKYVIDEMAKVSKKSSTQIAPTSL